MELIAGLFLTICGIIMFFNPSLLYELTESWKSYSSADPSELYIFSTKVGGVFFTLVGIASVILYFVL